MSILKKDLDRLLEACSLQDKAPLFVTSNLTDTVVSLPIISDNETIIITLLSLLSSYYALDKLY